MKNKVISAMLLGMSATMAVPGTVVMAAEDGSGVYRSRGDRS
ncbi:MAG: hypothetical protein ACLTS6_12150 [Anaerobutyricum sp.]